MLKKLSEKKKHVGDTNEPHHKTINEMPHQSIKTTSVHFRPHNEMHATLTLQAPKTISKINMT